MAESKRKKVVGRRAFLLATGGVAGAVGATVVAAKTANAAVPQKPESNTGGYRKSDHIRKYYELTRF